MPPVVVLPAQEQELVRTSVEPRDPRTALVERRLRLVHDGEQGHVDVVPLLQALEQLVADLLRAAADNLGVEDADQQDLHAAPFFARTRAGSDRRGMPFRIRSTPASSRRRRGAGHGRCGNAVRGTAAASRMIGLVGFGSVQAVGDDFAPRPGEQPAVDQGSALMHRQAMRSLALQMPQTNIVDPRDDARLDALQAQVGILVMSEHVVFGESAELLDTRRGPPT